MYHVGIVSLNIINIAFLKFSLAFDHTVAAAVVFVCFKAA